MIDERKVLILVGLIKRSDGAIKIKDIKDDEYKNAVQAALNK